MKTLKIFSVLSLLFVTEIACAQTVAMPTPDTIQSPAPEVVAQSQQPASTADGQLQFERGASFLSGTGVAQDLRSAFELLHQSAELNNSNAQYALAGMYDEGTGVPQDYQTAATWNLKAAEQGHSGALYNLGVLYSSGDGVGVDIVRAHMWFNLAAAKGHGAAIGARKKIELKMSRPQIAEAQALATQWQMDHR